MRSGKKRGVRIAQLERRRFEAAQMFAAGARTIEVARACGVAWRTAFKWRQAFARAGLDGLRSRGRPGREPLLGPAQRRRLRTILRAGPRKSGFEGDAWTIARVHAVVQRVFGISCSKVSVWRMLRQAPSTAGLATRRGAPPAAPASAPADGGTAVGPC